MLSHKEVRTSLPLLAVLVNHLCGNFVLISSLCLFAGIEALSSVVDRFYEQEQHDDLMSAAAWALEAIATTVAKPLGKRGSVGFRLCYPSLSRCESAFTGFWCFACGCQTLKTPLPEGHSDRIARPQCIVSRANGLHVLREVFVGLHDLPRRQLIPSPDVSVWFVLQISRAVSRQRAPGRRSRAGWLPSCDGNRRRPGPV